MRSRVPSWFQRRKQPFTARRGGKSPGSAAPSRAFCECPAGNDWQPVPGMYIGPLTISRITTVRLLPPRLAGGISGEMIPRSFAAMAQSTAIITTAVLAGLHPQTPAKPCLRQGFTNDSRDSRWFRRDNEDALQFCRTTSQRRHVTRRSARLHGERRRFLILYLTTNTYKFETRNHASQFAFKRERKTANCDSGRCLNALAGKAGRCASAVHGRCARFMQVRPRLRRLISDPIPVTLRPQQ